jgi:hypothetical protein
MEKELVNLLLLHSLLIVNKLQFKNVTFLQKNEY